MKPKSKKTHKSGTKRESRLRDCYPSMAACAWLVPLGIQKLAKRSGCQAFRDTRVYLIPLLEWVFSRDDSVTDWTAHGKKFDALLKEAAFRKAQGDTIDTGHVETWARTCMAVLFSELEKKFVNELPPNSRGREAVEIRVINQAAIEELKNRLRVELGKLLKEEAKELAKREKE